MPTRGLYQPLIGFQRIRKRNPLINTDTGDSIQKPRLFSYLSFVIRSGHTTTEQRDHTQGRHSDISRGGILTTVILNKTAISDFLLPCQKGN